MKARATTKPLIQLNDLLVVGVVVLLTFLLLYRLFDHHTLQSASCVNVCSTQHSHHLSEVAVKEEVSEPVPKKHSPPAVFSYPASLPSFELAALQKSEPRSLSSPLYLIYQNLRF